jgi:hypothetical protein
MSPTHPTTARPQSVAALDQRREARHDVLVAASREYVHWTLQAAYARIREAFPAATRLFLDTSERPAVPAWIEEITDDEDELWRCRETECAVQDSVTGIEVMLESVLACTPSQPPPGWLLDTVAGRYEIDLAALPAAVEVAFGQRDLSGYYPDPTGLAKVIAAALDTWLPGQIRAAREYARGLVEGRYHPLTVIDQWTTVPAALGYPVPDPGAVPVESLPGDQFDPQDWQMGITSVHGLAAGVVGSLDAQESDDTMLGNETTLHTRVMVYDADLAEAGLTLAELPAVFGGDVRAAAVLVMQARPNDPATHLEPEVVPCRGCRALVTARTARRYRTGWLGQCCRTDAQLDPVGFEMRMVDTTPVWPAATQPEARA